MFEKSDFDLVYQGFSNISEKVDSIGSEIYDNLDLPDFKNYLLDETRKIDLMTSDYQQLFADSYNPGYSNGEDNYGSVLEGFDKIRDALSRIQDEIYENVEAGEFKRYILGEISRAIIMVLDYQKGFVEGYCRDDSERRLMSEQIQQKIDAINAEIEKNGPSL